MSYCFQYISTDELLIIQMNIQKWCCWNDVSMFGQHALSLLYISLMKFVYLFGDYLCYPSFFVIFFSFDLSHSSTTKQNCSLMFWLWLGASLSIWNLSWISKLHHWYYIYFDSTITNHIYRYKSKIVSHSFWCDASIPSKFFSLQKELCSFVIIQY